MKHPVQALLWEQWRQTWKVIPFSIAMIMIILWFLPQYLREYGFGLWQMEVGLLMCGLLSGLFCMALQGEGGARGGTLAHRHFVLPVSSLLLASVGVFVFCLMLLGTLGAGIALFAWDEQKRASLLLNPNVIVRPLLHGACFVLAYSLTIGTRNDTFLRVVLALLVLVVLVTVGQILVEVVGPVVVGALALGISVPIAAYIIRRDRHRQSPLQGGSSSVLSPVAALAGQIKKLTRPVPAQPHDALLWSDLRAGKKLLLPGVIAMSAILIFLAIVAIGHAGELILTRLHGYVGVSNRVEFSNIWGIGLSTTGIGLFVYILARIGPRLVGGSTLFTPWSAETSYWKRQPVSGHVLATVKLKSIMLQCLCWSLCLCAMIAFIPIFIEVLNHGILKVRRDGGEYLQENGVLRGLTQLVARPVLLTTLVIWTSSGLISAIALTGRKWFFNLGFTTLAFAVLAVLRLVSLSSSWKYYDAVQPLNGVLGVAIILLSIGPLVWTVMRGYAHRPTLLLLIAGFFIAGVVIFTAYPRMTFPGILELSMYALPFAPLGLLPMAVKWGRRL